MWRWEDVKKGESKRARGQEGKRRRCEDVRMWRWEDVKMRRCEDVRMWRWEDVRRCEKMWEDVRRSEDVKMRRCEDVRMWRWEDVKMRRCEDVRMRRCEKMWEDVRRCEDERMRRRWEDEKMWSWEDVKMWRCEDEMWRGEDVKMRGCEDEMWRWEEDEKKMRCEDEKMFYRPPLLEEPCAQTLSGINPIIYIKTYVICLKMCIVYTYIYTWAKMDHCKITTCPWHHAVCVAIGNPGTKWRFEWDIYIHGEFSITGRYLQSFLMFPNIDPCNGKHVLWTLLRRI